MALKSLEQENEQVSMFLSEVKGSHSGDGTYIKRGNYIFQDSETCNQNLISRVNLHEFIKLLSQ